MANADAKTVVAGDVSIDWFEFSVPARETREKRDEQQPPLNWQLQPGTRMIAKRGGALLLARFVGEATASKVITHKLDGLESIPPETVIHSLVELDQFPYSSDKKDEKNLVYRVKRFHGFSGPQRGAAEPLPVTDDDPDAGIVVLDDAGNGFRDAEGVWPRAIIGDEKRPILIFKMMRPLCSGKLWNEVRKRHADRMVVVVHANDLRAAGVNISRRLSWERTAKDFVWQIACNPDLMSLANSTNLIVTFGIDAAVHYSRNEKEVVSRLYYDPAVAEDGFRDACPGDMLGFTSTFVAALTARVVREGLAGVGEGVRDGLRSARRLFRSGFGNDAAELDYPGAEMFHNDAERKEPRIADVVVPGPTAPEPADPNFWCILKDLSGSRLEDVAYDIVTQGEADALETVPVGRFGALKTVDRAEIESFRTIRNLILEYLQTPNPKRPLSIAVFGPPGSGKSFGVIEVAKSIKVEEVKVDVEKVEFNVAQFVSTADLVSGLHRVRDVALKGKVPLVFFDEFDSAFDGKLGWLKYFLAPMQDGEFKDGETMHPIGKAIFVFAGGTSWSYEHFCRDGSGDREFADAKGPDFVSRLRGYVNILGPNPIGEGDNVSMIRRAMLLRSLLEKKAGHLFDSSGQARIDNGVLRAFLKVPHYKHGTRSIEAIIDMSMLAGRKSFEQAALPPTEQLKLHVDAEMFSRLVVRDVLFGSAREILAKAIHEKFRRDQAGKRSPDDPSMRDWDQLPDYMKESNRQQADQTPEKLRRVGCGFAPVVGREAVRIEFTDEEIEILAEMEHDRWVTERRLAGWRFGREKSEADKTSPYMVPWEDLTDDVKEWDRQTVRGMPHFMAETGFEIYRLD